MTRLLALEPSDRRAVVKSMPPQARLRLVHDWRFWGRPDQVWRPGPELFTVYLAGRGWGKTRVGAEAVRHVADNPELCGGRRKKGPGDTKHGTGGQIGIAGRTANDVNETMLYGPSGLMSISPPWNRPRHYPSKKLLLWPNGVIARLFSGDVPDSFRGPNIGFLWADELAHWSRIAKSWKTAKLALRHGDKPRVVVTTTPIGIQTLIELIYRCKDGIPIPVGDGYKPHPSTRIVHGSTYDNVANLAPDFLTEIVSEYEGTEEGDQELHGVVLLGVRGAPWSREWFRRCELDEVPEFVRVIVAVDPTVSEGAETSEGDPCECGIVVVGLGVDGRLYLLEDASGVMSPKAWGSKVVQCADAWSADRIVAEENQGGELVRMTIAAANPRKRYRIQLVRATRDKFTRFALAAPLWQHERAVHVGSPRRYVRIEHQMVTANPNRPIAGQQLDRVDAVTWGALALLGDGTDRKRLSMLGNVAAARKIAAAVRGRRRT